MIKIVSQDLVGHSKLELDHRGFFFKTSASGLDIHPFYWVKPLMITHLT